MLTYSGAQAFVDAIYQELRQQFAIPACAVFNDESAGNFGIAHFWGLTADGCANLTFDNDHIPAAYVARHEAGHALSALHNGGSSCGPMHEAWWRARGFPGTAQDSQNKAIAAEQVALNSGYRFWPEEMFADTFGVVTTPYAYPLTDQMGIWLDQEKMLAFYRSLGPGTSPGGDDMALTQEEHDAIVATAAATRSMADVLNALAKTSLPEWLDRLGDRRDVKTGDPTPHNP